MAISKRMRWAILRRDRYTCYYCGGGSPRIELVIDHVIPRSQGGTDDESNLVTACVACNSGKSDTMPETWLVEKFRYYARWNPVELRGESGWEHAPGEWPGEQAKYHAAGVSYDYLATLSGAEVLRFISDVYGLSIYRPDYDELIRAAAALAKRSTGQPVRPLSLAEGPVP